MPTRMTTLALILTSVSLALPAAAQQGPRDGVRATPVHAKEGWRRDQGFQHRAFERMRGLFETYDTDGDGSLTQEEIDTARAAQLARFDTDKDGSLSLVEYEALWLDAMRERMVDRFQSHDDDGDGLITAEEFQEGLDAIVSRMDRNGDGALSRDDMHRGPRMRQAE